jgi:hypothetical protein
MRDRADTTHAKSAKATVKTSARAKTRQAAVIDPAEFEIDSELLDESYNQTRRPLLPYGIVVNDKPAGILIPTDQLEKADWLTLPEEDELTTVSLTEDVTGLLITEARMLVLAHVPEYIRYKSDIDEVGGTVVGLYDEYRNAFDKKTMDACSEHALVFLDENNQPLHTTAIVVRFKNVALWSFKSAREDYYRQLEKAFAEFTGRKYSGKNDKWRSLGVLEVTFKAAKEGEGSNKSWCCKTENITTPTKDNFSQLFLGTSTDRAMIWGVHDAIAGFTETQSLPALPGEVEAVSTEILPTAASRKLRNAQFVETKDERDDELDDDFLEAEAEEVDDDLEEDFDFDDDEED